jgi:hypothetical protein
MRNILIDTQTIEVEPRITEQQVRKSLYQAFRAHGLNPLEAQVEAALTDLLWFCIRCTDAKTGRVTYMRGGPDGSLPTYAARAAEQALERYRT